MTPPPAAADVAVLPVQSRPGAVRVPRRPGGAWRQVIRSLAAAELRDPRLYQIACLGSLLVFGVMRLELQVPGVQAAAMVLTVLATQYAGARLGAVPRFDPRSALISGLSLCLLLRTNVLLLAILAAVIAIASKFVLRVRGKHVFNPTNFALAAMMLLTGQIWVSPGQWGSGAFFGFLLACAGGLVVNRAARSDVTYAFIGFYAAMVL